MAHQEPIDIVEGWAEIKAKAVDVLVDQLRQNFDSRARPFDNKKFMEVYTICYNLCTQRAPNNFSENLYAYHGSTMTTYLGEHVLPALRSKSGPELLSELIVRWKSHKIMNKWMKKFFAYLDRYYVKHHSHKSLHEVGITAFKTEVYLNIKEAIVDAMLGAIERERLGEEVDHSQLKSCIAVFELMGEGTLNAYINDFQDPLLTASDSFYNGKSSEWMASDDTPTYLLKAEAALNAEVQRVKDYLIGHETESKLLSVCEKQLLEVPQKELLERPSGGCASLLKDDKVEDLERMYQLFNRLDEGLVPMAIIVEEYFKKCGDDLKSARQQAIAAKEGAKESASDPTLVRELIELHKRCQSFVDNQFQMHPNFQRALKTAFENLMNKDVGRLPNAEYLAAYCDRILKKGGERLSDKEIETQLTNVVQLFSYLNDKDLFSEIYRNLLSKRLLNNKSANDDAEKSMISKLKLKCGAQFTSKMEGMRNDLLQGKDHVSKFAEFDKSAYNIGDVDFSVQVLTTGFWPSNVETKIDLPPVMKSCVKAFTAYYDKSTEARKLKFVASLGNCTVQMKFGSKKYDLNVTTLQAACLQIFNTPNESELDEGGSSSSSSSSGAIGAGAGAKDVWSLGEIVAKLQLDEKFTKKVLHSLSCGKYKVLKKEPKSKKISHGDTFCANVKFTSKNRKIRIPMASLTPSHNPKKVEEDRTVAIEAAIVRIMKARKTMKHNMLIAEVVNQLHFFRPQPKSVKRRIEHLIDREYLERDEDESNVYRYLA